jgi:hypothetical protein
MEKKDALLMLLLAGAGGYAVYANWEPIRLKLGLDDLHPGRIKAVQLAKEANSFEAYSVNSVVLRDREANGEIKLQGEPWSATEIKRPRYRVTCTFFEKGQRKVHRFAVDVASGAVLYEGLDDGKPAPR